jgi:hypothetical protein
VGFVLDCCSEKGVDIFSIKTSACLKRDLTDGLALICMKSWFLILQVLCLQLGYARNLNTCIINGYKGN